MASKQYDFLVVGAGLYGSTFANAARKHGAKCLVIDRRDCTGGNVRCENIEGITVHKYGAHIFHTSDKGVWRLANSIVEFNRFTNSPLAKSGGRLFNLPFNMNTFRQMWGVETPSQAEEIINRQRSEMHSWLESKGIGEPRNLEEQALLLVGADIYHTLIEGYTEKQWGRKCRELPAFIIKRLPVRLTYDNNYFNDAFQGIPIGGYNRLVDGLLEGIEVKAGADYLADRSYFRSLADKVVFTGPIDEYFGHCLGRLEYRTVRFDTEVVGTPNFQGNAVVNYVDASVPFTRIIEHKHFEAFGSKVYDNPVTVVSREYPAECRAGSEPCYPVNDARNMALYARYKALAGREEGVAFGGRLAEYRYYDMAPAMAEAIKLAGKLCRQAGK